MNRRSFLKSVGKAVGGVLGIGAVGLPKAKAIPDNIITTNGTDAIKEWQIPNYFDFAPDMIVSVEKFHGRLIIFCEHSVWEIEENCYGVFQRKLLSTVGCLEQGETFDAKCFMGGAV